MAPSGKVSGSAQSIRPYHFIDRTVRVLLVDDDETVRQNVEAFFARLPLYELVAVPTATEAMKLLSRGDRFHTCLYDFGIKDIENDEFYLLKRFAARISFVIISGTITVKKGFDAKTYGARYLLEKPLRLGADPFLRFVNKSSLLSIINPNWISNQSPIITQISETLITRDIAAPLDLAAELHISTAYLRKVFSENFSLPPRHLVFLVSLLKKAFSYYEKQAEMIPARSVFNPEYLRIMEYYTRHGSSFRKYLLSAT